LVASFEIRKKRQSVAEEKEDVIMHLGGREEEQQMITLEPHRGANANTSAKLPAACQFGMTDWDLLPLCM
jgi:hypothetical protein